jgi:CRP-like cAMP-binding protein
MIVLLFLQQKEHAMKKYLDVLLKTPLFQGMGEGDIAGLLDCLAMRFKQYGRNETIFWAGDAAQYMGMVISGAVRAMREDVLGNRSILGEFGPGELFGEAFSLIRTAKLPVTVLAVQDSEILLIDSRRLTGTCAQSCARHTRLIENMMAVLAEKNVRLNEKMEVLTKRSTREKLLTYLYGQARKEGRLQFTVPFNRQELADYLCVDRSAMSSELGRLQAEGILSFERSSFELHRETALSDGQ